MEAYYIAALKRVKGLGDRRIAELLNRFSSAKELWESDMEKIRSLGLLQDKTIENFQKYRADNKNYPEKLFEECKSKNIKAISIKDEAYPYPLKQIHEAPAMLFFKGDLPSDEDLCIAMVGSRNITPYGKQVADMIAQDLARAGVVVVSGAARGIDTASHIGALKAGRSIAVLGCGVDVIYPQENRRLFYEILNTGGAIISEYPPGTSPYPAFFPARNRIISGISYGTIVVEAGRRSGALITAEHALNEGRDVFAVPGSIFSHMSEGTNRLIKEGAKPVTEAYDIVKEYKHLDLRKIVDRVDSPDTPRKKYKINASKEEEKKSAKMKENLPPMTAEEKIVYQLLSYKSPLSMDEILISMPGHIEVQNLSMILLQLTMKGIVKEDGAQKYLRVERT
ncbi:MAG: DNA-processing protein DprA [Selenomonadaceae bacterium]|nr:DNA-processing protein DprA [Selenomonadaceae bacterium]